MLTLQELEERLEARLMEKLPLNIAKHQNENPQNDASTHDLAELRSEAALLATHQRQQSLLFDDIRKELEAKMSQQLNSLETYQQNELFSLRQEFKSKFAIMTNSHAEELLELRGKYEETASTSKTKGGNSREDSPKIIEMKRQDHPHDAAELTALVQVECEERIRSYEELDARWCARFDDMDAKIIALEGQQLQSSGDVDSECNLHNHEILDLHVAMRNLMDRLEGLEAHVKAIEEAYLGTMQQELGALRLFAHNFECAQKDTPWDIISTLHAEFSALRKDVTEELNKVTEPLENQKIIIALDEQLKTLHGKVDEFAFVSDLNAASIDTCKGGKLYDGLYALKPDVDKLAEALGAETVKRCAAVEDMNERITKEIAKVFHCLGLKDLVRPLEKDASEDHNHGPNVVGTDIGNNSEAIQAMSLARWIDEKRVE